MPLCTLLSLRDPKSAGTLKVVRLVPTCHDAIPAGKAPAASPGGLSISSSFRGQRLAHPRKSRSLHSQPLPNIYTLSPGTETAPLNQDHSPTQSPHIQPSPAISNLSWSIPRVPKTRSLSLAFSQHELSVLTTNFSKWNLSPFRAGWRDYFSLKL